MENTFYLSSVCIILSFVNIFYFCVFYASLLDVLVLYYGRKFYVLFFCLVNAVAHKNKEKKSSYVQITWQ